MPDVQAVGIDLGTTNSAVAWVDQSGRTAMLRNSEGDLLTPSVVFFDDAEIIVGKEALRAAAAHPDRVAQWVKRDMGSPVYSRPIRGQYLPPEVIQSCILRKLRADVVAALGTAVNTVITVPAYFDEPRRKATADAGEMAGLTLLDIVNEPTAAALAFGEVLGYLSPSGAVLREMVVMIYDLGGGTFDATLLRLAPGDVRTLATDGDVHLGGHDWDARLVDYAAESFQKTHGIDLRDDPAALNRLYSEAVEAKHALSARTRTLMRVEHAGRTLEVPITREQFEEMTADLLERTAYTSRQLVAAAGLQWKDVSRILLVGGSTRMPMVSRRLQELTGILPDRTVNPDEAVARGAALYARYLLSAPERGGSGAGFQVVNVNSHSLGIEGIDPQTLRKINVVLIPRNTPLPARHTERFMTKTEGQRSIVVQVLEGESSLPGECTAIGRTVLRDLPAGLPKGWPIEVTFEYGANGRLTVRATVPGTHRETTLELERDVGLSREGVSRWKQLMVGPVGFDCFEDMLQEVLCLPAVPPSSPATSPAGIPPADDRRWDAGPVPGTKEGPGSPAAGPIVFQPLPETPASASSPLGPTIPSVQQPERPLEVAGIAAPQPAQNWPDPLARLPTPPGARPTPQATQPAESAAAAPLAGFSPGWVQSQPIPLFAQEPASPTQSGGLSNPSRPPDLARAPGAEAPGMMPVSGIGGLSSPGGGFEHVANSFAPQPFAESAPQTARRIPRWVFSAIGYGVSAAVGLAMGYWLIRWLFPQSRLPRWW